MKRYEAARSRVLAVFVLAAGIAGSSQGQVAVGDSGTPSYAQAIQVPPGVAGMAPKLGLLYSAGGVNGPLGYGWSVQGLSMITRCASIPIVDGKRAGVVYGPADKLCLDGQRLIQTDAAGVASGFPQTNDAQGLASGASREFRTEKEIYARIRAYGYANGDTSGASGPAYFRVWTKAGQIYDYGANPNISTSASALIAAPGKAPMAWAAARISDTLGNYIDFRYEQRDVAWGSGPTTGSPTLGHEWNILEVQYSGNKIVFNYDVDGQGNDLRPDKSETYQEGQKNVSVRRLKSITTYVNSPPGTLGANGGTAVRTVQLSYDIGPVSGRSRVQKIQECAGGPGSTRCQPATTFNYAAGGNLAYTANPAFAANTGSGTSPLHQATLLSTNGGYGVLTGDFNGDGRTDILRWSNSPSENRLYFSNGLGGFTEVPVGTGAGQFNLTDLNLFQQPTSTSRADGCYMSFVVDINGDGRADIFRWASPSAAGLGATCPASQISYALISQGDGSFERSAIRDLSEQPLWLGRRTPVLSYCGLSETIVGGEPLSTAVVVDYTDQNCYNGGANFFVGDFNGDGYPDLIEVAVNGASYTIGKFGGVWGCGANPNDPEADCYTRVRWGLGDGRFGTPVNIGAPVSADPRKGNTFVADVNGDGLADVVVRPNSATGYGGSALISRGDGQFTSLIGVPSCEYSAITEFADVNGDGRADFICAQSSVSSNAVYISTGGAKYFSNLAGSTPGGTRLNASGQDLVSSSAVPGATFVAADFDGDGRSDVLRVADNSANNVLFLSNGDGTFRTSALTMDGAQVQLNKSDGTFGFTLGDFLGNDTVQLLKMINGASTGGTGPTQNQLFTRIDPTPADQLIRVTGSTGLKTTLFYVPLTYPDPSNGESDGLLGPRYVSDLDNTGNTGNTQYSLNSPVDLTLPMYVVATMVSDTGVGSATTKTELSYRGLKADRQGRGLLGFRQVLRQQPGADGSPMTVDTRYLQKHPYIGVAASTASYLAKLNQTASATQLSKTTNIYCDQTNATAAGSATESAPCESLGKIAKPYLYKSTETGKDPSDPSGPALPTVVTVNTFNGSGDPSNITVTTSATVANVAQQFTKVTSNQYLPDDTGCAAIADCAWILGRLSQSQVTNTVPNSLSAFASSPGTSQYASATQGSGPVQGASLSPSSHDFGAVAVGSNQTKVFTLTNPGTTTLTLTMPGAAAVTGTDFSFVSTTCTATLAPSGSCTVTVKFAPTATGAKSGNLSVSTASGILSASLAGSGQTAQLSFNYPEADWGTRQVGGTYASVPITLSNTGTAGVTNLALTASSSWSIASSTCSTTLAAGASCSFVVNWSPTVAQTYSGQLSVSATGWSGSLSMPLKGIASPAPAAQLSFNYPEADWGTRQVGGTYPSVTITLSNTGTAGVTNLALTTSSSWSLASNTCGTTLAAGASCTFVVNWSPTVAQAYNGQLSVSATGWSGSLSMPLKGIATATPVIKASSATVTSTSTYPNAASGSVSFTNEGLAPTTLTLSAPAGATLSTTSLSCPAGGGCGSVTITRSSIGTSSGSIGISSSAGGTLPTVSVSLTVNGSIATMTSSQSASFGTVTQGAAPPTVTYSFRNDGNVPMTLIASSINVPAGMPFSWIGNTCFDVQPTASCAFTAQMATGTVGTFSKSGIEAGGSHQGYRTDLSMTGTVAAPSLLTYTGPSAPTAQSHVTWTFTNPNTVSQIITNVDAEVVGSDERGGFVSATCAVNAALAPQGSCTVTLLILEPLCNLQSYSIRPVVSTAAGTVQVPLVHKTSTRPPSACPNSIQDPPPSSPDQSQGEKPTQSTGSAQ